MKKLSWIYLTVLVLITANGSGADVLPKPAKTIHLYTSHYENVLGTSLDLKVMTVSPQEAEEAEKVVLQKIAGMSALLSAYDANSEFSRWLTTSQQAVPVSHELFEVLALFDQWRMRTGGALDASAEVITRLWRQAAADHRIPSSVELANAVHQVAQPHWKLDAGAQTATHLSNVPLILNSFAKSYIIKHAADAAMALNNVRAVIVNIGGDLVVSGTLDEKVAISDPRADAENDPPLDLLRVSNKAIATSVNYRRGVLIAGHWYSHIVDPRTGLPADNILSATVIAPNATDAGALATAFNVMSPAESRALVGKFPGVEYLLITKNGQRIASPGWNALKIPRKTAPKDLTAAPADFELIVNLEINLPKEGAVKRPYVAVWVENEDHAPVRTISIWHGSDRYLPELKSWFLKYRGLYTTDRNFNSSVTSATRSAGKYSVKWDGKDDQGNLVKPGKYIIKIEASREHGTYQLMRQEIECDETPKTINLAGNIEIASATLDYRKRTNGN